MHDEDASDRATKGIVTTYAVALPEGAVSLTIRHRSVTVEVRRRARAACLACPRRPSSPWPVECSGGGARQSDVALRAQPPTSELFRLMGAAVWPAALGAIKVG